MRIGHRADPIRVGIGGARQGSQELSGVGWQFDIAYKRSWGRFRAENRDGETDWRVRNRQDLVVTMLSMLVVVVSALADSSEPARAALQAAVPLRR
jgi:hypothetical protein